MKREETAEKIRKRERRHAQRENSIVRAATKKNKRTEKAVYQKNIIEENVKALESDNFSKKKKAKDKKPGCSLFLQAFSFIPTSPYDKRHCIPADYHCRSFNMQRQYIDFLKEFIYPYTFPHVLLWAALEKETYKDERNGNQRNSPYAKIIQLAKKWISDIISGESFYKRNKDCFTKAEAHFFLSFDIPYREPLSVIEQYFYAKCLARSLGIKPSRKIARIFALKFSDVWNHHILTGFLDLITRSGDHDIEFGDICDFVLEIIKSEKNFSFSGRTMTSIVALANEWHAEILNERQTRSAVSSMANKQSAKPIRWNGISISTSRFEQDKCAWLFSQLHTVQDLLNEGRTMKNCVSSYAAKCAAGDCAIFHVSCLFTDTQRAEDKATLEVSRSRALVQAKAKCNAKVSPLTMSIIRKWAQANKIKLSLAT